MGAHWLLDDPPPGVDAATDVATISAALTPPKLDASHPLRATWETATDRAMAELHQLADDIRTVKNVPGVAALLGNMKEDAEGYRDLRYELRMGANFARSERQKVLRFAGRKPGPDIEFVARCGQVCGVACYSARSDPPYIENLRKAADTICKQAWPFFRSSKLLDHLRLDIIFSDVPLTDQDVRDAVWMLHPLLTNHMVPAQEVRGRVAISRMFLPAELLLPGDVRVVRLRFAFCVRDHEKRRVIRAVSDKVVK
jgi:hypothetical protein